MGILPKKISKKHRDTIAIIAFSFLTALLLFFFTHGIVDPVMFIIVIVVAATTLVSFGWQFIERFEGEYSVPFAHALITAAIIGSTSFIGSRLDNVIAELVMILVGFLLFSSLLVRFSNSK